MCACEAHYDQNSKCTCNCQVHETRRREQAGLRSPSKDQYWVTEIQVGLKEPNYQMRFLNDLERDGDAKYELVACDPNGHYIFKVTEKTV